MTQLAFSYHSSISGAEKPEKEDSGLVSFSVDFSPQPDRQSFNRTCYALALDEVTSILAEKYGDTIFDDLSGLSIQISGLTVT